VLRLSIIPYGLELKLNTHVFTRPPFVLGVKTCWNNINLAHLNTINYNMLLAIVALWQSWVDGFVGRWFRALKCPWKGLQEKCI